MTESSKTYLDKINSGFFLKYLKGVGIDFGYKGYAGNTTTILPNAKGIDIGSENYDGKTLPFADKSQHFIYSSHVLEHISDRKSMIQEWFRVIKTGGFIITIVPHQDLYEKKTELPSQFNGDHKIFFRPSNLLKEFEDSLPVNSFRVRHLQDNDQNHDYQQSNFEHSKGCYEIELVIEKIV